MNDVGGTESGRGLRAVKSSRTSDTNFDNDDSEWDVGIGNLIIDLDADIEKTNEATRTGSSSAATTHLQNLARSLPPTPNSQMHIPQSPASSSTSVNNSTKGKSSATSSGGNTVTVHPLTPSAAPPKTSTSSLDSLPGNSVISVSMEHSTMSDKGLKMKIKRSKPGTKSVDAKHEIVKSDVLALAASAGGTSNTSLTKSSSNVTIDTKPSSNSSSQKEGKETKVVIGQDKDSLSDAGNLNDQNLNKGKTAKRTTSTHKKVKLATGVTASIVTTSKKDVGQETKSGTGIIGPSTTSMNSSLGNNHGKESFSSISLANIGAASAFVKTSASSNMKIASQGSILGNDLAISGNSAAGNTTNFRSLHNSTSHNSSAPHTQLTSGSPAKTEKVSGISPLVVNSVSEKGLTSSPSYGKKPRVSAYLPLPEKTSGLESTTLQIHNAGVSSTGSYRSLTSAANDSNTASVTATTGSVSGNLSSVTSLTKELTVAMNSRVPSQQPISFQDACVGTTVGTVTEPDCLGPCEPGSTITLEGIVWQETENGVLVVNVTWRGKTYVGTLLDCTKNDWASPRFCDSPTSDLEMRTPKNRGKRGRAQTATPVSDPGVVDTTKPSSTKLRNGAKGRRGSATNAAFVAPVSPMKPDQWPKRKTRGSETESQEECSTAIKSTKRLKLNKDPSVRQANSPAPSGTSENSGGGPFSPTLIECPEPNCSKKYKHINGLRYHQSHAHSNNFGAEDSDSNLSTASNTNLNSAAETVGTNDETPESRIDVDAIECSGAESNSAPTTPVKTKAGKPVEGDVKEKIYEISVESDEKSSAKRENDLKQIMSSKLIATIGKVSEKDEAEKVSEKNENLGGNKEKEVAMTGLSSRTPILTVPTLPFMSLQNRTQLHSSLHRTGGSETSDKPNREQEGNVITKTGTNSSAPTSKGIPWQPHAISSFHSQPNLNIPVTLNVPLGSSLSGRDHDKSSGKDLKNSSSLMSGNSSTKKPKHKKKSKEKGEKERDRDREKSKALEYVGRESIKGIFSPTSCLPHRNPKEKDERRSIKGNLGEEREVLRRDSDSGGAHSGENREDPQSPAYSDISDANDSGPESDMKLSKDIPGKTSAPDMKKDGSGGSVGQNLPSFYSPFYTPIDSPFLASSNPSGIVKSDRNTGSVTQDRVPAEDQVPDKLKSKSSTSLPQHISGHMDERRSSPKLDYHSKYLPPQQHYFSYPYPNYHFDQPYGLLPENSYSHNNRSIMEEKERETEEQRIRLNSKGRMSDSKDEIGTTPTNLSSVTIKQEPGLERGKEHRSSSASLVHDEKSSSHSINESKVPDYSEYQESKRHGASSGMSHYTHTSSSKHSKESRREREERHAKESENKEAGKINSRTSSQEQSNRTKNMDLSNERNSEKDSKNEGAKPTMETQGPPPPPTAGSYAYYPPGYLQNNPYSLPFDPNHHIFRQVMVPGPYPGSPYMHSHPGNIPRFSQPPASTPLPEDLSRSNSSSPPPKALDLLQHHAAQYYASHKIHELQERALKSPSPQINSNQSASNMSGPTNLSSTPASPSSGLLAQSRGSGVSGSSTAERKQPTDLSKDVKPSINPLSGSGPVTESSRLSPIHHVHTHMHRHTHIGYHPIISTVPPQYSPNLTHFGVMATPASAPPASVIPPFTSQKPT